MKWCIVYVLLFCFKANAQIITTFAGGGAVIGDGGPATSAILNAANGGVFDKQGNFYVCEAVGHRVRKIVPSGTISRTAGNGSSGAIGDGGVATSAQLSQPTDVTIDTLGNIYISDQANFKIRKVDAITGIISTVVGTGVGGYNGDGISGISAQINVSEQIWADKVGNLFICDRVNNRVRKVNSTGIISTVAGYGGFSSTGTGDGGQATSATFNWIAGVAADDAGNIFIADYNAGKIRKVNALGVITTISGNGSYTYIGDGIPATDAQFAPTRLTFDTSGNLVIADRLNRRVYRIDNTTGIFHCIAGNGGAGFSGDGGLATAATLDFPAGVTFDPCGNLYIAEAVNKRVRKVTFNPTCDLESLNIAVENTAKNISIYPNPANNELQIENVQPGSGYKLYDVVGAIKQQGILPQSNNTIPLHLPPGIYLLQIADGKGARTIHKIIKE